jgi:hypothetical protein
LRARSQSPVYVFLCFIGSQNDEACTWNLTSDSADCVDAIGHGHSQIEKANIREGSQEAFNCFMSIAGLGDDMHVRLTVDYRYHPFSYYKMIVGYQDSDKKSIFNHNGPLGKGGVGGQ